MTTDCGINRELFNRFKREIDQCQGKRIYFYGGYNYKEQYADF